MLVCSYMFMNKKSSWFYLELLDEDAENELELGTVLKNELELVVDILETSVCTSISVLNAAIHYYSINFAQLNSFFLRIFNMFIILLSLFYHFTT